MLTSSRSHYQTPKVSKNTVLCELFLWRWSTNESGKHPVKIRVTYHRKRKYYPVQVDGKNLFLTKDDWDEIQDHTQRLWGEKKSIRVSITSAVSNAEAAGRMSTLHGRPFTFDKFENEFFSKESSKGFLGIFETHLQDIYREGRIGTYRAYNNAFQALKKFRSEKEVDPADITPKWLKNFEMFLVGNELSKTTVGMYLRAIKVIYNVAVTINPTLAEFYPFSRSRAERNKYRIKSGSGKKGDALDIEQINKMISIPLQPGSPQFEARAFWMISFYLQGANMRDILLLKKDNLKDGTITYVRSKTKNSEINEEKMEVLLNDSVLKLLEEIGTPQGNYLFDCLSDGMSLDKQDAVIRQKIKTTNKWLKAISSEIFDDNIVMTTYWARHSYSNLLKQSGASLELIRELLGHADIRTTETYLKRFDLEKRVAANNRVFDLINN
jgi:integrase/recombinase XerD